jgi:hypothetical protein
MNAYELADIIADPHRATYPYHQDIADMLRQQADRIAELEKEVLMWENAEVPTEVMADLIQELERRKFITTPQIKELSDVDIEYLTRRWFNCHCEEDLTTEFKIPLYSVVNLCKEVLKKASEK